MKKEDSEDEMKIEDKVDKAFSFLDINSKTEL